MNTFLTARQFSKLVTEDKELMPFGVYDQKVMIGLQFRPVITIKPQSEYHGVKFSCAPGLRIQDDSEVSVARQSGWILGYDVIQKYKNDNLIFDWMPFDDDNTTFAHLSNGLIRLSADNKNVMVEMDAANRRKIIQQIFGQLHEKNDTDKSLYGEGFLVLRYKRENQTTEKAEVDKKISHFADAGLMPPIVATPVCMELLSSTVDLTKHGQCDADNSIPFNPELILKKQTETQSILQKGFDDLKCDLNHMEFINESIMGDMAVQMNKSVLDLTTDNDIDNLIGKVNETMELNRKILVRVMRQQNKTADFETRKIEKIAIVNENLKKLEIKDLTEEKPFTNNSNNAENTEDPEEELKDELDRKQEHYQVLKKELEVCKGQQKSLTDFIQKITQKSKQVSMGIDQVENLHNFIRKTPLKQRFQKPSLVSSSETSNLQIEDITKHLSVNSSMPLEKTTIIAAISAKDAASLMPRYLAGETINNYVEKIRNAWSYCKGEGFREDKFCQILRLNLPTDAAQVMDNMEEDKKTNVEEITREILSQLDLQTSEYLREFSTITKRPTESYSAYALRLRRLYKRGTGQKESTTAEKSLMVETFLKGLNISESTALRLVASEKEMKNLDQLVKRAARLQPTFNLTDSEEVNVILPTSTEEAELDEQTCGIYRKSYYNQRRAKIRCFYCTKKGHPWRRCFIRIRNDPEWTPKFLNGQVENRPNAMEEDSAMETSD